MRLRVRSRGGDHRMRGLPVQHLFERQDLPVRLLRGEMMRTFRNALAAGMLILALAGCPGPTPGTDGGTDSGTNNNDAGTDGGNNSCSNFATAYEQLINAPTTATSIKKTPTYPPLSNFDGGLP